jgi:hypothetical protein
MSFGVSGGDREGARFGHVQKLGVESRTQAVIAAAKIEIGQWSQPAVSH